MPSAPGGGPQPCQMVMYRSSATVAYPAVITGVNGNGTVSLTTFPPGSAPGSQSNVAHDASEKAAGRWYYAPYL